MFDKVAFTEYIRPNRFADKLELDMERIRRHTDKPITDDWKDVVEEILTQELPKRAQAIADQKPGTEPIVVRMPITFFLRFGRQADNTVLANADVDCSCFRDDQVCICYGTCPDFPDICDEIPPITEGLK
jgi:hypothetical protein